MLHFRNGIPWVKFPLVTGLPIPGDIPAVTLPGCGKLQLIIIYHSGVLTGALETFSTSSGSG